MATTVRNPQTNAILERAHGVIHNLTRAQILEYEVKHGETPDIARILSNCAYAMRSTIHSILRWTPAQIVFSRDMILPVQVSIDWDDIKRRKMKQVQYDNQRENKSRKPYTYSPGDYIVIRNDLHYGVQGRCANENIVTRIKRE